MFQTTPQEKYQLMQNNYNFIERSLISGFWRPERWWITIGRRDKVEKIFDVCERIVISQQIVKVGEVFHWPLYNSNVLTCFSFASRTWLKYNEAFAVIRDIHRGKMGNKEIVHINVWHMCALSWILRVNCV